MNINGVNFLIGADPEVFLQCRKTKRFLRASRVFVGDKLRPAYLDFGNMVQVDGMAVEFNPLPSENVNSFSYKVSKAMTSLNHIANKQYARVVAQPTVEFDDDEWEKATDNEKRLGCDPDYNAWTMDINEAPDARVEFRSGAGHIATGWGENFDIDDDYLQVCGAFARMQDAVNGTASLLYDQDTRRRSLYGKAGAFRPKSFGVEYRTLSNKWVKSKRMSQYVARRTFQAASLLMDGATISTPEVEGIINENKVDEAIAFLNHHKITLPHKDDRIV